MRAPGVVALVLSLGLLVTPVIALAIGDGGVVSDGSGLVVNPTSLGLGSAGPGQQIGSGFTLTNTELINTVDVTGLYMPDSDCANFTLTPPSNLPITMGPQEVDSWSVSFSATAPGDYFCHVEFVDLDANLDFIDLYASVMAPMMVVSPMPVLDFGNVLVGDSDARSIFISNNGTAMLTIDSVIKSGSSEFTMGPVSTPFQIFGWGSVVSITITYSPLSMASDSGSVVISGDDPNNPSDTVTLMGNGTSAGIGGHITLDPDPLAFGSVDVGDGSTLLMSIGNAGVATATVSLLEIIGPGASNFTIEAFGCNGMQTCTTDFDVTPVGTDQTVPIRCAPTSPGNKAATLRVTSTANNTPTTAELTCYGTGADVTVSPTTLSFGTVRVGTPVILPVTLQNIGNENLTYTLEFTGVTDYVSSPPCSSTCMLVPSQMATHMITFTPTAIGLRNASLVIESNDALEMMRTVNLTGIGGGGVLTLVTPASGTLPFGNIPVDTTSSAQMVQIRNDGNLNLKIDEIELMPATAFGVSGAVPPPDVILIPGQTHTLMVTCTPPDTMDYTANLTYSSDAPVMPIRAVILGCTGVDSDLAAVPAPIAFAPTRVGDDEVISVRVTNVGGSATTVQSLVATPAAFTIENAPSPLPTLQPDDDFRLDLRFTPTADGDVNGTLIVTASGGGDPLEVTLFGPGRVASYTVTPASHDFGTVCVGSITVKRFSVMSTGSAEFEIEEPTLIDPDVAFDLTMIDPQEPAYPVTVAPSGTVTVDVTAMPTSSTASGTLGFETDVVPGEITVDLDIVAISSGVGVGPGTVDFGAVLVDDVSSPSEVTLANCDVAPLAVSMVRITGVDALAFAVGGTLPPPDLSVPVAGTARWTVVFRPTRAGAHAAALEITHALGTTSVPLYGSGGVDMPDAGPGGGEDAGAGFDSSYYACKCNGGGDPAGAAPLLLAAVVVIWPRRRRR